LALLGTVPARGQILLVTNYGGGSAGTGTVGAYSTSGSVINASLISGLTGPLGIAVSGTTIYVTQENGTVGAYNVDGTAINASLITGITGTPYGIAVSGNDLFVSRYSSNAVAKYTTSGELVDSSIITGLHAPASLVISGTTLYVANSSSYTVGAYTTSGATINASFVSTGLVGRPSSLSIDGAKLYVGQNYESNRVGMFDASDGTPVNASFLVTDGFPVSSLALFGGQLFVANVLNDSNSTNTIGVFDSIDGSVINASLFAGLSSANSMAVMVAVPEPSTYAVFAGLGVLGLVILRTSRREGSPVKK
jgi:sugar lactone lactonase YvrE